MSLTSSGLSTSQRLVPHFGAKSYYTDTAETITLAGEFQQNTVTTYTNGAVILEIDTTLIPTVGEIVVNNVHADSTTTTLTFTNGTLFLPDGTDVSSYDFEGVGTLNIVKIVGTDNLLLVSQTNSGGGSSNMSIVSVGSDSALLGDDLVIPSVEGQTLKITSMFSQSSAGSDGVITIGSDVLYSGFIPRYTGSSTVPQFSVGATYGSQEALVIPDNTDVTISTLDDDIVVTWAYLQ